MHSVIIKISNPQRIATNSSSSYFAHFLSASSNFKPSKDRYKLRNKRAHHENALTEISNPQRIATNLCRGSVLRRRASAFQTLKGSLQTPGVYQLNISITE